MDWSLTLNALSAAAAFVAAVLWLLSARVRLPTAFPLAVLSMHNTGEQPVPGEEVISIGSSPDIDRLGEAMIKQSDLSARAAFFAGVAAIFQAAAILAQSYGA